MLTPRELGAGALLLGTPGPRKHVHPWPPSLLTQLPRPTCPCRLRSSWGPRRTRGFLRRHSVGRSPGLEGAQGDQELPARGCKGERGGRTATAWVGTEGTHLVGTCRVCERPGLSGVAVRVPSPGVCDPDIGDLKGGGGPLGPQPSPASLCPAIQVTESPWTHSTPPLRC